MNAFEIGVAEGMVKTAEGEEPAEPRKIPTWAKAVGGAALGGGGLLLARRAFKRRFPTFGNQGPLTATERARAAKGTARINKRRGG